MHKTTYTEAHHLLAKFWKDYNKLGEGENKNSLEHYISKSKPFGFLEKALAEHKRKVKNHVKEIEDHHKNKVGEHVKGIEDHHKKNTNQEQEKHRKNKEDKAEPSERKEEVDNETTPLLGKEHDNQVSEVEEILGQENASLAGKGHGEVSTHGKGEIAEGITKEIENLDKHVKDLREKNVEVRKYISNHSYFYTFPGQSGQESVCIQDLYSPKIFA
ncbi:unnamed protein product [Meloidogyne enterolobii]|uniref:Uncharacterized protein n=1 Tax=Meloidogyne enterolobii TaxID=390850 RepID=A0ACB1B7C4_MELEN